MKNDLTSVLVVAPHMDDEVLGCGGSIARHVKEGCKVTVCVICNRAYNGEYNEDLINREKKCSEEAKSILNYDRLIFLDQPDEQLYLYFRKSLQLLEKVAKEVNPDIVYIPFYGDIHQDHKTAAQISNIVFRPISNLNHVKILAYEIPSSTNMSFFSNSEKFNPNYFINIKDEFDLKIKAMEKYESESRSYPHPRSPDMLRAHAQHRGASSSCELAEAFMVLYEVKN